MSFCFSQQRPGSLSVNFIGFAQQGFERARILRSKPLQKVRTPQPVAALGQQNNRATLIASLGSHLQRLMRLNQIDVPGKPAATGYHNVASAVDCDRVTVVIIGTSPLVSCTPVPGINANGAPLLINYRTNAERRIDKLCNPLACLVNGIPCQQS